MFNISKIDVSNIEVLERFLARFESVDPYALSPSYFAITGRRGLWLYDTLYGGFLMAVHPNLQRTAIVFPPYGVIAEREVHSALESIGIPYNWDVLWGRIPNGMVNSEKVLDWRYPVHILGVDKLLLPNGERFRDYRKNLNRAERSKLSYRLLNPLMDADTVIKIASNWAWANKSDNYSFRDLISPTMRGIYLAKKLPIHGVVILYEGEEIGFGLWEEARSSMANGISGLLSGSVKGGSEFLVKAQIEVLSERGVSEFCIGGSETKSLDSFKRKLCPVRSVALGSYTQSNAVNELTRVAA